MIFVKDLIGLKEVEAIKKLGDLGVKIRIVSRDGKNFVVTSDFKNDRVNLSIENGKVSKADVG